MNKTYELTFLEPFSDETLQVTVSDEDYRLDMGERLKAYHGITLDLEKLTRELMLSAGRFSACVLHSASESSNHLSKIEEYTKELRLLLDFEAEMDKKNG